MSTTQPSREMRKARLSLEPFRDALRRAATDSRGVDIRAFELSGAEQLRAELKPFVVKLLEHCRDLLGAIIDSCEANRERSRSGDSSAFERQPADVPFEHVLDSAVAKGGGSMETVAEIAYFARLELTLKEERLRGHWSDDKRDTLLDECDSSLRRIRKSLGAVDATIARTMGTEPALDFFPELDTSLRVRRAYGRFRRGVLGRGAPTDAELRRRFRAVGTRIAMLIGWDVYPELRVRDRLLVRQLQARVLDWLGKPDDASRGFRIWHDVQAFVEMLVLVNRRQEIQEHDRDVLRSVRQRLTVSDSVDSETHRLLSRLEGLDEELDEQLESSQPLALPTIEALVERLSCAMLGADPTE